MTSRLLFCDTDCLIQLFIGGQTKLLKWLRRTYDLGAVIVPEVEIELSQHRKFGPKFDPNLTKAVRDNTLSVFDYSRPEQHLPPNLPTSTAIARARAIVTTGAEYNMRVDRGEAYSHAACVHLEMPMLSHDLNAILVLQRHGLSTAAPTLRVFDLVCLAYNERAMDERECDHFRQALYHASGNEWMPKEFKHSSFAAGFGSYKRRLFDRAECAGEPAPCRKFDEPYYLVK